MVMTTTFCRSRVRLLPLLALLAVATSLLPLGKAMGITAPMAAVKGAASEVAEVSVSSFDKKLHKVKDWFERGKDVYGFWDDHGDDIKEQLPQLGTPSAGGNSHPGAAAGYVVDTGNQKFSVSGIDIESPVTRTGTCDAVARPVSCGALLCRQLYGGRPLPNCATGAELCGDPHDASFLLYQGTANLLSGPTRMSVISYACRHMVGPSTGGSVLGLGRTGTLAHTFGGFSYVLSDKQAGGFWLGGARAPQGQAGIRIPLIANPVYPDRYYVQITRVLVGDLSLQIPLAALDIRPNDGSGGVYLSTTMPFAMVLQGDVYELLKAALQIPLGTPDANSLSPCYFAGATTKVPVLPTIKLVFANNAVMALQPGPGSPVWYQREDGAQCLSVVPSPTGETILGTMAQRGRLMTYKLAADGVSGSHVLIS